MHSNNDYCMIIDKIVQRGLRHKLYLPFFLNILNYDIKIVDKPVPFVKNAPACVSYLDQTIWINVKNEWFQQLINDHNMTETNLLSLILLHEILHPTFLHLDRMKDRDHELWNISCDYMINLFLKNLEIESKNSKDSNLISMNIEKLPKDYILLDDQYENMLEEEIYDKLKNTVYNKTEQYANAEEMKDYLNGDTDQEPTLYDNIDQVGNEAVKITTTKIDGHSESKTIEFLEPIELTDEQKERMKQLRENNETFRSFAARELSKGVQSATMREFLGKIFKVKIDWGKILKNSIMTILQTTQDQEWSKPRTVWMANPHIPYLPNYSEEEKSGIAVISIDESGSMSNKDVAKAVGIIAEADEYYKSIFVIIHDYNISNEYYFEDEITNHDINDLLERKCCGGTSHKEVFERIADFQKKNIEDKVSIYIGITDMYSDIEHHQEIIKNIPTVWISNSDHMPNNIKGKVINI